MKCFSEETRIKMSESAKRRCTPEWRKQRSESFSTPLNSAVISALYHSGLTQCEIALKLGTTQKVIWGFMHRNGIKARTAIKRDQIGEHNSNWKGESALYGSLHQRVKYRRGVAKDYGCSVCGTRDPQKYYDWANLTGNYNDVNDYAPMCRSCHRKYDIGLVVMPNAE